jgi:hypothetical protein
MVIADHSARLTITPGSTTNVSHRPHHIRRDEAFRREGKSESARYRNGHVEAHKEEEGENSP